MSAGQGFLVVLSDVKSEDDRDYIAWLTTEHVQERLGIPGFLGVRIFRMPIAGGNRYLIWYRLENSEVVDSPAYLERLNNPTPWSQRIMPILGNFERGGGAVVASAGKNPGAFILATSLDGVPSNPSQALSGLILLSGINAAHLLVTDMNRSEIKTNERELRKSNGTFANLMVVESDSANALNAAQSAINAIQDRFRTSNISGLYRQVLSI